MNRDPINQKSKRYIDKTLKVKEEEKKNRFLNNVITIIFLIAFIIYLSIVL
jgi:hypothetical protein